MIGGLIEVEIGGLIGTKVNCNYEKCIFKGTFKDTQKNNINEKDIFNITICECGIKN